LNDFTDAKIIGQKSTIYDDLAGELAEMNTGATHLVPLESVPEVINTLNSGISDATIVERPVALSIINSNPSLQMIEFENGFEVAEEDKVVSIGVRKIDTNLLTKINSALNKITEETREELMLNASLANAE
jgi:ABC-type amino acid transport substrate-binding protein